MQRFPIFFVQTIEIHDAIGRYSTFITKVPWSNLDVSPTLEKDFHAAKFIEIYRKYQPTRAQSPQKMAKINSNRKKISNIRLIKSTIQLVKSIIWLVISTIRLIKSTIRLVKFTIRLEKSIIRLMKSTVRLLEFTIHGIVNSKG